MARSRGRPAHPDVLTPTEWAVLDLYRHGLSRRAIAARRGTSEYAARYHLRNISAKLGLATLREVRDWPGMPATSPLRAEARRTGRIRIMDSQLLLGELGQVSLLCRSAEQTETWYRDTLRLPHLFTFGDLVFFDCGGTRLYFRQVPDAEWRKGSTLYFRVPDINAAHALLAERGVHFLGAPHLIYRDDESGSEEWMAFFDDPDGNALAVMARITRAAP